MHVLIINTHYSKGGASRAARRLQVALNECNIKADYLSLLGEQPSLLKKIKFNIKAALDRFPSLLVARKKVMFSTAWLSNSELVNVINAHPCDIVHLHWINSGALSISDLTRIKKPIVWSLHDMWPFTGGCHYSSNCEGYIRGCGQCPLLQSDKENDLSSSNLLKKRQVYSILQDVAIVGLSSWMAESARKSYLFNESNVVHLPNPIDTSFFISQDSLNSRNSFKLPVDKKLVLFGAMSAVDDTRKGYRELTHALKYVTHNSDIELVVFGSDKVERTFEHGYVVNYVGYINSDTELRKLYSAADVMIVPSLQENLSNAIMESMSCSTPVVAFDIGGNKDMVDHKYNGYLATPYNPKSLAAGISWILNSTDYDALRRNAREKIISKFDNKLVALQYKCLYESSLSNLVERSCK